MKVTEFISLIMEWPVLETILALILVIFSFISYSPFPKHGIEILIDAIPALAIGFLFCIRGELHFKKKYKNHSTKTP